MARPSDFTQDTADEICALLAEGKSLRSICLQDNMPTMRTVLRWLAKEEHEPFRRQYAHAREAQADALFDETLDIADENDRDVRVDEEGNEVVNYDVIQRAKLRIDTRKWIAGKLRPKVYGDKVLSEITGKDGSPIQVEDASEDRRRAALALLLGRK